MRRRCGAACPSVRSRARRGSTRRWSTRSSPAASACARRSRCSPRGWPAPRAAQALGVACAVEFLHSSSLILDDLPSMDDADLRRNAPRAPPRLRRGRGGARRGRAAQPVVRAPLANAALRRRTAARGSLREAARCVGSDGMVGGQVVDLETRAGAADEEALACRDMKTVALMRLMMTAGALACGAGDEETLPLARLRRVLRPRLSDLRRRAGRDRRGRSDGQARAAGRAPPARERRHGLRRGGRAPLRAAPGRARRRAPAEQFGPREEVRSSPTPRTTCSTRRAPPARKRGARVGASVQEEAVA